jgi:TolB protein
VDLVVVRADGGKGRVLARADEDVHFDPSWSPDGHLILYSHAEGGDSWSIRTVAPGTGARHRLVGHISLAQPDWSPNGRKIAVTTYVGRDPTAHLYLIARRGRRLYRLARDVSGAPAWAPDGSLIAFPDGDRIRVIRADGKASRTVTQLRGADISDIDWSPDGKRLTFVAGRPMRSD